ncbi:MAG: hypothetical protein JEZ08_05220 [Clostridiales bacterium]|nr:hypothetical protein [Clostridiales bacterium]
MQDIIRAFNITGTEIKLSGGQGTSIKVGDYVLKPVIDSRYANWCMSVLDKLSPKGYRISKPIRSIDCNYVYNNYLCTRFEVGYEKDGLIDEKLEVSKAFQSDLKGRSFDDIPYSDDPWSNAHRVVWHERKLPEEMYQSSKAIVESLLMRLFKGSRNSGQIIHSDLGGNITFDDLLEPLIIEFSPTIGTREYSDAIMVCDQIAWSNVELEYIKKYLTNRIFYEWYCSD